MEMIEFNYCFKDGDNDAKQVRFEKRGENGIADYEVCTAFLEFMESVGYSIDNIYKFFQK